MKQNTLLCSCIICKDIKSVKGIFTHYLRSHGTEEEKERMSRGNLNKNPNRYSTVKQKFSNIKQEYFNNPLKCQQCCTDLSYELRHNKFCSRSCAATFNNTIAPKRHKIIKPIKPKKIKIKSQVQNKITNKIKMPSTKWSKNIVGPFSNLFSCQCKHCLIEFVTRKKSKYCSIHQNLYKNSRNKYQFTFNVFHYPDLFNINLISKFGWYSPGNRGPKNNQGVSRDHKISVNDAVKNNYDPFYITHPLNCELMLHSHNKKKYTKSSITYIELINLVDQYELARGSGNAPHPLHQQADSLAGCV